MMTPAEILQAYASLGWKNNNDPMSQVLALRREDPAALGELVLGFLDSGQKHSTFIDTALDLMDDASYAPRCGGSGRMRGTASTARRWKRCWIRRRCNGLNCIRAVGEQLLAATRAEAGGPRYYADFAWRAMDAATAHEWLDRLDGETDERCGAAAPWRCCMRASPM